MLAALGILFLRSSIDIFGITIRQPIYWLIWLRWDWSFVNLYSNIVNFAKIANQGRQVSMRQQIEYFKNFLAIRYRSSLDRSSSFLVVLDCRHFVQYSTYNLLARTDEIRKKKHSAADARRLTISKNPKKISKMENVANCRLNELIYFFCFKKKITNILPKLSHTKREKLASIRNRNRNRNRLNLEARNRNRNR
jgi:hypothetical protein